MTKALDRPVWASLLHRPDLSEGGGLARRYRRDVNLFASARDDSKASQRALAALVGDGESLYVLQVPEIQVPDGLTALRVAQGVQMIAARAVAAPDDAGDFVELGDADAPEMLALARLTEPGPFLARTHHMGRFVGIRVAGRLAAMAGERMGFPGYAEVSGVCTHPEHRGRGLARQLSARIAHDIQRRGEQAFLHAWASNQAAIALYQSLGFEHRAAVQVAVLGRSTPKR
ncbi:GNAT family N-acetyltransferase [Paucibacter sp. APW11]|uniref:GNAT family N-acetyltransferase n=1 Tax=Roseateles aquae TaxID=3077235 RepID=A0ABU3PFL3_9BURK|nr:GNAT family N-acetyltransferase [Paucibacter sp. APW11]MDT9001359.1 GNAT family N-acetyltransferase [Paucibacter sp. APW11]